MIVGVSVVKDEADVIGAVCRHLLAEGVDRLVVMDNLSTDGTRDILNSLPVTVIDDPEFGHFHGEKISRLARQAHADGADWVLPFDADEVWYSPAGTIAEAFADVPDRYDVVPAPGWDHIWREWTNDGLPPSGPFSPWRRQRTQELCKVAFRAKPNVVVHMGNHDVAPEGHRCPPGVLMYRHFQYRSLEQMTRKLRNGLEAMEATDLHPMHCEHWRSGGLLSDDELSAKWDALRSEEGLIHDPAPLKVGVGT